MNDKWYLTHGYKLYYDSVNKIKIWIIPEFLTEKNKKRFIKIGG